MADIDNVVDDVRMRVKNIEGDKVVDTHIMYGNQIAESCRVIPTLVSQGKTVTIEWPKGNGQWVDGYKVVYSPVD